MILNLSTFLLALSFLYLLALFMSITIHTSPFSTYIQYKTLYYQYVPTLRDSDWAFLVDSRFLQSHETLLEVGKLC